MKKFCLAACILVAAMFLPKAASAQWDDPRTRMANGALIMPNGGMTHYLSVRYRTDGRIDWQGLEVPPLGGLEMYADDIEMYKDDYMRVSYKITSWTFEDFDYDCIADELNRDEMTVAVIREAFSGSFTYADVRNEIGVYWDHSAPVLWIIRELALRRPHMFWGCAESITVEWDD
jgi:hypothetical protein